MDNTTNNNSKKNFWDTIINAMDAAPESPIEDRFESKLLGFLDHNAVTFKRQHEIQTAWGQFRLDFILMHPNIKLAIECDGKDYHDKEYDFWRDALILNQAEAAEVIRIDGTQIYKNIYSCLYQLSQWHPVLFSDKEKPRILSLALDEIRNYLYDKLHYASRRWDAGQEQRELAYMIDKLSERDVEYYGYVTRRKITDPEIKKMIHYARQYHGTPIADLIKQHNQNADSNNDQLLS